MQIIAWVFCSFMLPSLAVANEIIPVSVSSSQPTIAPLKEPELIMLEKDIVIIQTHTN